MVMTRAGSRRPSEAAGPLSSPDWADRCRCLRVRTPSARQTSTIPRAKALLRSRAFGDRSHGCGVSSPTDQHPSRLHVKSRADRKSDAVMITGLRTVAEQAIVKDVVSKAHDELHVWTEGVREHGPLDYSRSITVNSCPTPLFSVFFSRS